jgi:hypothetical protein
VLAVAFPGLAAPSALGFAVGRLMPFRLAAPVAGIGTYSLMVGVIDTAALGGVRWLAPVLSQYDAPGYQFSGAQRRAGIMVHRSCGRCHAAGRCAAALAGWLAAD